MNDIKPTQDTSTKATHQETIWVFSLLILSVATFQVLYICLCSLYGTLPKELTSRLVELTMLIPCFIAYKKTRLVQQKFGFKVEAAKVKHVVLQCLLLAAAIVAGFAIVRLVAQQFIPSVAERPFFQLYLNVKMRAIYPLVALLQESLSKGFLLYALEKIFPDKYWPMAVILMSAFFAMLHVDGSAYYVLGSIVIGLITGWIYHRDQNIWRCSILHFLFGFLPRCFGLK